MAKILCGYVKTGLMPELSGNEGYKQQKTGPGGRPDFE